MKVLVFDNYDSFTWNLIECLRLLKVEFLVCKNDEDWPEDFDQVILSPGPDIPKASGRLMEFIGTYYKTKPILGVCLGHQAIAEFFGGTLINMPEPLHGEQSNLKLMEKAPLFQNVEPPISVGLYHSWRVSKKNFPNELSITAESEGGIIMALEHKSLPLFGVQFHPESYMTRQGQQIIENFISLTE